MKKLPYKAQELNVQTPDLIKKKFKNVTCKLYMTFVKKNASKEETMDA